MSIATEHAHCYSRELIDRKAVTRKHLQSSHNLQKSPIKKFSSVGDSQGAVHITSTKDFRSCLTEIYLHTYESRYTIKTNDNSGT